MEEVVKYLTDFGFSKEAIPKILNVRSVATYADNTLLKRIRENINWLKDNGYNDNEIKKMIRKSSAIISNSKANLEIKKQFFIDLGYTEAEFQTILRKYPNIVSLSRNYLLEKINYFLELGFTMPLFIRKSVIFPTIFCYSLKKLVKREELFLSFGYTKAEYLQILKLMLGLLGRSDEHIINRFNFLMSLGYSKKEIIYLTSIVPPLFGYSSENITNKIAFFKKVGLENVILKSPMSLTMCTALVSTRYEFLKEQGIDINKDCYNYLFYSSKIFTKQFGISKEELLDRYSYQNVSINEVTK